MFEFVQSWFSPGANPIGIDFGTDSLRLAQVEQIANPTVPRDGPTEFRLIAAARAEVPASLRDEPAARLEFFARTARELVSHGNFRGRRAILGLPASLMSVRHLRLPRMDEEALKKALPWEARGKLPYDPGRALLRHLIAGEIYQDGEQKNEVILMAANRESVNQLLTAAAKAKLDIVGMNVEPKALIDCFSHVYRRRSDSETTCCFVDIGSTATRVVIARAGSILFVRVVPIGGDHFTRAVASATKTSVEEARILRMKLCHAQSASVGLTESTRRPAGDQRRDEGERFAAASSAQAGNTPSGSPDPTVAQTGPGSSDDSTRIDQACAEPLAKLVEELALCRHYHEATFPNLPVGRLIFVGGESRHRGLCQSIARGLDLSAQLGDPLARMGRISDVGIESGIDRRLPQPDWAIAIGLSMGAPAVSPVTSAGEPSRTDTTMADAVR